MKKPCQKAVLMILVLWSLLFLTDVVCAFLMGRPVFMIPHVNGCNLQDIGLGYGITHSFNMTPDGVVSESFRIQPHLYVLLSAGLITWLLLARSRGRAK